MEPFVMQNRNTGIRRTRVLRGIVLALLLALLALSPAEAASKPAPKKVPGFDPLVSSPDVLAFKTSGRNVRITASADAIRAKILGVG